jgi:hypothetical protein
MGFFTVNVLQNYRHGNLNGPIFNEILKMKIRPSSQTPKNPKTQQKIKLNFPINDKENKKNQN